MSFALLCPWTTMAQAAEAPQAVAYAQLSPQTELAITRGLAYLAKTQQADGGWGRPAYTAVALMAFMLKGYFPTRGRYGNALAKAVDNLVHRAQAGGGYIGNGYSNGMYDHALATMALAEVWGQSDQPGIREALKQAVHVIIQAQSPKGGWRYTPLPVDQDTSVTVMVTIALVSARDAGILVPKDVIDRAVKYIRGNQTKNGGFGYTNNRSPAFARSAAGVLGLQLTGHHGSRAVITGLQYLQHQPDRIFTSAQHYCYAQYYAIQAMYQHGGNDYKHWYARVRDALLKKQHSNGSWRIEHDEAYSTAMSILVLGVPYRYLPIYQR